MTDLREPDEPEELLDRRFRDFRDTQERSVRNELVEAHRGWRRIANDYRGRGVDLDDLVQIAMLGILKAVEKFDPDRGIPLLLLRQPHRQREIKRYFRDRTWAVRPPSSTQERHLDLRRATATMSANLGRPPTVNELAAELEISEDEVLEAMEAGAAYRAASLDARRPGDEDGSSLAERLPGTEPPSRPVELRLLVGQLLDTLPPRRPRSCACASTTS